MLYIKGGRYVVLVHVNSFCFMEKRIKGQNVFLNYAMTRDEGVATAEQLSKLANQKSPKAYFWAKGLPPFKHQTQASQRLTREVHLCHK